MIRSKEKHSPGYTESSFTMLNLTPGHICILANCPHYKRGEALCKYSIISKSLVCLIYMTTSKHAEKGCHLTDLMFPDSNELAFIGTLCTFTRKASWHKVLKQFMTALANQRMFLFKTRSWSSMIKLYLS